MAGRLFYTGVAGFGLGVLSRSLYELPPEIVPLALLIAFACGVLWQRRSRALPHLFFGVFCLSFALGLLRVEMTAWQPAPLSPLEGQDVARSGIVVREPDVRAASQQLYVKDGESGEVVLVTTDSRLPVIYGDAVTFSGTLELPETFETDLGRTFDYPGYLRARGVVHRVAFADVEITGEGNGNPVRAALLRFKRAFIASFEQAVPEPAAGLGEGLLLGEKRAMGDDLEDVFRRVGIIHIVVLSGYNIMVVADWVMAALSLVLMPRARTAVGGAALSAFALMVGLSATVLRASIMAVIALIGRATGRRAAVMRTLMIAGAAMVLIDPYLLAFDPGFQLSFAATLGLILFSPHVERWVRFVPETLKVREYVVATLSTQFMVMPLLLYLIGTFSAVAVAVNVLVLGAVPFAMFATFAVGMLGFLSAKLALLCGLGANILLLYIIKMAEAFAALPFAAFAVPAFPFVLVVAAYAAIAYVLWRLYGSPQGPVDEPLPAEIAPGAYEDWTTISLEVYRTQLQTAAAPEGAAAEEFPFR
jgi:competence protein ComEC